MLAYHPGPRCFTATARRRRIGPHLDDCVGERPAAERTVSGSVAPRRPSVAVGVQTIGSPSAAASSSLFFVPPPDTNGKTATACVRAIGRRSGTSGISVTPGAAAIARTSADGLNPMTVNRASGTRARTIGHTDFMNQSSAWMFGPKSRRPQNTAVFGCTGSSPGAKNDPSMPSASTSTVFIPASHFIARRSVVDTTHARSIK
jgi:hypothetical protein